MSRTRDDLSLFGSYKKNSTYNSIPEESLFFENCESLAFQNFFHANPIVRQATQVYFGSAYQQCWDVVSMTHENMSDVWEQLSPEANYRQIIQDSICSLAQEMAAYVQAHNKDSTVLLRRLQFFKERMTELEQLYQSYMVSNSYQQETSYEAAQEEPEVNELSLSWLSLNMTLGAPLKILTKCFGFEQENKRNGKQDLGFFKYFCLDKANELITRLENKLGVNKQPPDYRLIQPPRM